MSGGSYDYAYRHVEDAAHTMIRHLDGLDPEATAAREWLIDHLRLVARAMRAVEWVDSRDSGPGDEVAAIREVQAHVAGPRPVVGHYCPECWVEAGFSPVGVSHE